MNRSVPFITTVSAALLAIGAGTLSAAAVVPPARAHSATTRAASPLRYFMIRTGPSERPFVVAVTETKAADALRRAIVTKHGIVSGIILPQPARYNPGWHFHLRPETVSVADFTTEVCDATATYVEGHLADVGGAFLPGNRWCPWQTRVLREVRPAAR
jgi:hypothetical protein